MRPWVQTLVLKESKPGRKGKKEKSMDKDAEKLGSVHCQLECKMVQPLWDTVQLSYKR